MVLYRIISFFRRPVIFARIESFEYLIEGIGYHCARLSS